MTSIAAAQYTYRNYTGAFAPTINTATSDKTGSALAFDVSNQGASTNEPAPTIATSPSGLLSSGAQSTLLAAQESNANQPKQSLADSNTYQPTETEAAFLEYMEKTPAERIREAIMKEMGITEEDLAAMSPEQRQSINEEIAQRMQDKAIKTAKDRENREA